MSENDQPSPQTPEPQAPPTKRTFRDRLAATGQRLRGTRGLIAATLAALIIGGVGGAAIHAAVDGDRHERGPFLRGDRPGELGRDFGERGPRDFEGRPPAGVPGELPPTTTPEDDDPAPSPSEPPSESSNS